MDKKQFKELMESMKKIQTNLDKLIRFAKISAPKLKPTPEETKVLKFCNSKHTIVDIARKTRKTKGSVEFLLNKLRSKGLIESTKTKGKLAYKRI